MTLDFNLLGKKIPFLIDMDSKTVNGEIKFLSANEYTVYWSWGIFSDKQYLGGENRNLFVKEDERNNGKIIERVIEQICKTRWGRKKMFTNFRYKNIQDITKTYENKISESFNILETTDNVISEDIQELDTIVSDNKLKELGK